jgi:glutathione synthase/RimK-type ligase-like ATP-grasp enzyme
MLVGIHKNYPEGYNPYVRRFEAILDYNGIEHVRLNTSDPNFWAQVSELDLFIYWWGHAYNEQQIALTIIPIVENEIGITCLPNMRTCWLYDDKIREYYLLKLHGFPIIPFWIFWDKKQALNWLEDAPLPVVFKLKGGAGSTNVVLVDSKSLGRKLIRRMFRSGMKSGAVPWGTVRWKDFSLSRTVRRWGGIIIRAINPGSTLPGWELHKNYVLFQKFLPNNDYDTRVTVIGDHAFAFRRFNRPNDFRSSGSGRIDHDVNKIDIKFVEKAFEVSSAMKFQSMAYDFLYAENGCVAFCEISYTYVDSVVYDCPGYWDSSLNWHEGHFWPQYCQLVDTLKLPDLRQPELEYFRSKGL